MTARILIVDDVPANARLLEAKLSAEYYQVATARDGFEGMALARSWQPDLILLDVMMPGMDGFECCRRLKRQSETLHIPVVMVTALGAAAERLTGLDAGADDFLTKPVDHPTLMARVRSLIRLKRLLDEWRARGETARALGFVSESPTPPSIIGARALVVDPSELAGAIIETALSSEGLVPTRVQSPSDAMALAATTSFDLVVLSVSMAPADPLLLVSNLRASDATHRTPLLLVGESADRDRILRAFEIGANDWVIRPLDVNELRVRARNQVRRKVYQDRLRADLGHALRMATTDPLTGLYNRNYLLSHLRGLLARAPAPHVSVLMIDVDHFKSVNDEYGHAAGDEALIAVAETLRRHVRAFDTLARYGGEEFVVVMPGAGAPDAIAVAERLRAGVEAILLSGAARLTVSVGAACAMQGGQADALLRAADTALYQAKRAGRNRVQLAGRVEAPEVS
ncbi:MAG TPA: PleD family two-component system response regulator [Acetobacteraceae bacterium]|nr:PleD family two-component system response regulator [Acetobacteraceae bacterium]